MANRSSAPGKIILSGEYAVVFGYPGIAVPSSIGLRCNYEPSGRPLTIHWPDVDHRWKDYLQRIVTECERIAEKKFGGSIIINNQLPLGKGMGSSTALVIAVSRCLIGEDRESEAKKIEDTVNPGNSGLDFAVIWHNAPLTFKRGEPAQKIDHKFPLLDTAELIDTGSPNETTPELVAWMKTRADEPDVKTALATIGACTQRLLDGESPLTVFPDHHRAQVTLGVVSEKTQSLIKKIEQQGGAGKVIGAGGRSGGSGIVLAMKWK